MTANGERIERMIAGLTGFRAQYEPEPFKRALKLPELDLCTQDARDAMASFAEDVRKAVDERTRK